MHGGLSGAGFRPQRALPPIEYDFVDVDDPVFEDDIEQIARAKISEGCNPGEGLPRFCPDDPLTRAQLATLLARAMGSTPVRPPPPATNSTLPPLD